MDRATKAIVAGGLATVAALLCMAGWIIRSAQRPSAPRPIPAVARAGVLLPPLDLPPLRASRRRAPALNVAYASLIERAAERHNLSPVLIAAMTRVESDFDPREVSHKGARGLMQVMPETGLRFGVAPQHLFDPERNIAAGTAYLSWLLRRYDGDLDLALAGYNAGEGAVDKYRGIPPYRETQQYVRKVRSALNQLQRDAVPGG